MSKKRSQKVDIKTGNISGSGTTNIAAGDIKIIQPPPQPTASTFFTIEAPPADFTGRETELQQLLSAFDRSHGALLCGLTGSGGIGKTVLARLAAQKLAKRFPDARLEINLLGASQAPLDPAQAMRRLLAPFFPAQKLPEDPAELRGLYLDTFRRHTALLLLDNAQDAAQVRLLLPEPPSAAIVTSRLGFSLPEKDFKPLSLDLLPTFEARQLLLKASPRLQIEPEEALDKLAALCGRLPLALRVSASHFESRPDWSLDSFSEHLADEHARLALLSDPDDADLNVHACLALSYDSLPAELQRRFRQLGVFAAPFNLTALAAVWDRNLGQGTSGGIALSLESESSLGLLLRRHLLDFPLDKGEYRLHDLTRLYALERLLKEKDEAQLALEYYAEVYLLFASNLEIQFQKGGENILPALQNFTAIWLHLQKIWQRLTGFEAGWVRFEGADRWLSDLTDRLIDILYHYLPPRELIPIHETALQAARRLGNRDSESASLTNLGNAWFDLGETRKACTYYEMALKIDKEIGDQHGEGIDLGNLGNAWNILGEPRKAIKFFKRALAKARKTSDQKSKSNYLGNLGIAYLNMGELRKAVEYSQQALEIDRETGNRHGEGTNLGNLGIAYRNLGEVQKSIEYHTQALEIDREIGDRGGEASNLCSLGNAWNTTGEPRKAIAAYEQALQISQEIGDRRNEGIFLGNLGLAWADLGDNHKAIAYYEQALKIAKETSDRNSEGRHLANLGNTYKNLGDINLAREYFKQALKIFRAIESPTADWVRQQMADMEKTA
jgi:tetratricopeptide (TPR) repeat protein